jgi:sensor histidine kinase YesM
MKKKKYSRITSKLLHQIFLIYSVIFGLMAILILSASAGILLYSTNRTISADVSLISDSFNTYWKNIQEKSYLLTSMDELHTLLKLYAEEPSEENYQRINLSLNSFRASDSKLIFVMMEDSSETVFHSINYANSGISDFIRSQEGYKEVLSKKTSLLSPVLTEGFSGVSSPYCYYLTTHTINGEDYLVTLCYDAQTLVQNIQTESQNLDTLQLYNTSGLCLYQTPESDTAREFPDFIRDSAATSGRHLNLNGYQYYEMDYYYSTYAIGTVSLSHLFQNLLLVVALLFVIYFVPLLSVSIYLIPVNERLLQPIGELTRNVQDFSLGQQPIQIYATGDEIEDLSRSFQKMSININQQSEALTQKEHEKAVTYYKLLTTQLDPHFIYNTMNIINILARQQAYEDIIRVNTALTRVLRERLNTQNTTLEEVQYEIQTLKQYQVIMDYRYHNQVQVDYDIESSVLTRKIPKNILQPLIENSYYHGLTRDDGTITGNIGIVIYAMDEELVIEISDDGQGMSPERLQDVRSLFQSSASSPDEDAHIGIANIYNRIQYLYGNNFTMDIQSEPGHGTTIVLTLPLDTL